MPSLRSHDIARRDGTRNGGCTHTYRRSPCTQARTPSILPWRGLLQVLSLVGFLRPLQEATIFVGATAEPVASRLFGSVWSASRDPKNHQVGRPKERNTMERRLLASGLGWPEGPAVLADGRICFVETYRSRVSVWSEEEGVREYAYTAGGPNSCVLGASGEIYVCQNGGAVGPWRADNPMAPSIQVIREEGQAAEVVVTEIDGMAFHGPNDLVFGADGRLYFTDPGVYQPDDPQPSRIYVLDQDGTGSLFLEFERPTYPNGIAVEHDGSIVWVESYTGMVRRCRLDGSNVSDVCRLSADPPVPDGLTVGADGRLFVASFTAGGIEVFNPDGTPSEFLQVGSVPTNCVFTQGHLVVTDAGGYGDTTEPSLTGKLWGIEVGIGGVGPHSGSIRGT